MAMHMIGNAHVDPVWLWTWQEGFHEVKASFQSALDRMEENEDFIFTCAGAKYYQWIEENAPEMFEKIRARVREGRWVPVGGMWIQPDCNMPSGESFARQFLYSQRYFQQKFGCPARTGYNVDSFGHGAMLPQLLLQGGICQYVWMRPDERENAAIPKGPMRWQSADGSEVLAYRLTGAYADGGRNTGRRIGETFALSEALGWPLMCFYGVGNHGGGPTRQNLAEIDERRAQDPEGILYSSPDRYFDELRPRANELPIWRGELQHHASGCYSACARVKRLHRIAENALLRAEKMGELARGLAGYAPDANALLRGWDNVLFNQFHDILCGCSIREGLDEACAMFEEAICIAGREENAAMQRISWLVDTERGVPGRVRSKDEDGALWSTRGLGTPVVVFNPHARAAEGEVVVRRLVARVTDEFGHEVPSQPVRAARTNGRDKFDTLFRASVPALGYRLYWLYLAREDERRAEPDLRVSETLLESRFLRAEFDPQSGALTSLVNKRTGREFLREGARARLVDIEHCDTWAHGVFAFDRPAGEFSDARIRVLERGPARARLLVETRFGDSLLRQIYSMHVDSDQLEVEARLNFHEQHRLLKLDFPLPAANECVAEVSGGACQRLPDGAEEVCQRWVALGEADAGGLCLINDGKYSFSAPGATLRLTAANSSIYADHYGQAERDESCEFMDQGEQTFRYALYPYEGPWQEAGFTARAEILNQPLARVVETYHAGPLPAAFEGARLDGEGVALECLKRAEDGEGTIARVRECAGRPAEVSLELPLLGRRCAFSLRPFEIRTLYLPAAPLLPARRVLCTEYDP